MGHKKRYNSVKNTVTITSPYCIGCSFDSKKRVWLFTKRDNFRVVQIERIHKWQNIYERKIKFCFGKRRKQKKIFYWLPAFSPIPILFSKGFFQTVIKGCDWMDQSFPKQALVFTSLQYKSFENTVGKGEIACKKQCLLLPQCFLPIWRTFCHFHQIWNCCLQLFQLRRV